LVSVAETRVMRMVGAGEELPTVELLAGEEGTATEPMVRALDAGEAMGERGRAGAGGEKADAEDAGIASGSGDGVRARGGAALGLLGEVGALGICATLGFGGLAGWPGPAPRALAAASLETGVGTAAPDEMASSMERTAERGVRLMCATCAERSRVSSRSGSNEGGSGAPRDAEDDEEEGASRV
jgi:hypothetical protein